LVEHQTGGLGVAGSNPVFPTILSNIGTFALESAYFFAFGTKNRLLFSKSTIFPSKTCVKTCVK
jgi:hypothetical protein